MNKVIVAITTYNLEKYVAQALDSVIMQKTNFKFKIKVADDCSTDRTPEILKEYSEKYPELIEVLYSDKNLGSLANSNRLFDHIDCEYFSFLDGDDYWIGEDRLQKQVDFLDAHPEVMLCGGNTQYLNEGTPGEYLIKEDKVGILYTFEDYTSGKLPFVHTSSLLVRNSIFSQGLPKPYFEVIGTFEECALRGEDYRRYLHLLKGPMYIMDNNLSVYRIHTAGMWQSKSHINNLIELCVQYNYYYKSFDPKYKTVFEKKFRLTYAKLMFELNKISNYKEHKFSERDSALLGGLLSDLSNNKDAICLITYRSPLRNALIRLIERIYLHLSI